MPGGSIFASLLNMLPIFVFYGIIAVVVVLLLRTKSQNKPDNSSQETQLIQEIHQNLQRMEDRIETLETLLIDDERTR